MKKAGTGAVGSAREGVRPADGSLQSGFRCRSPATLQMKGETGVTAAKRLALAILHTIGEAEAQLIGKAVILTDGTAGTVESIWLDDFHGQRVSIRGHPGKRPVSAVKFAQS